MKNKITSITPFLTVSSCKNAVEFYVSAFGGIVKSKHNMEDSKLSAQISIEGADFWVADEEPEFGNLSPDRTSGSPVRIILQSWNADELFEKAIKHGATEICPMTTEEDWRIGKLKDPFGHVWEIGYPLGD
jgi:PhnB protein